VVVAASKGKGKGKRAGSRVLALLVPLVLLQPVGTPRPTLG
jgi:hypothetical protein